MINKLIATFLLLFCLCGCDKQYTEIEKQYIIKDYEKFAEEFGVGKVVQIYNVRPNPKVNHYNIIAVLENLNKDRITVDTNGVNVVIGDKYTIQLDLNRETYCHVYYGAEYTVKNRIFDE